MAQIPSILIHQGVEIQPMAQTPSILIQQETSIQQSVMERTHLQETLSMLLLSVPML